MFDITFPKRSHYQSTEGLNKMYDMWLLIVQISKSCPYSNDHLKKRIVRSHHSSSTLRQSILFLLCNILSNVFYNFTNFISFIVILLICYPLVVLLNDTVPNCYFFLICWASVNFGNKFDSLFRCLFSIWVYFFVSFHYLSLYIYYHVMKEIGTETSINQKDSCFDGQNGV